MTLTSHLSINDMKEIDKLDCPLPPENVKSMTMFNSHSVEECKETRNEHNQT